MTKEQIIIVVLAAVLAVAVIAVIVLAVKLKGRREGGADRVNVVDGVRYSKDESLEKAGEANITHLQGDIVLKQGEAVKAVKGGSPMPGTYTVLAVSEKTSSFKLRLGGYVRDYKHGDTVVLGEGDEICAVSGSVILR